MRVVMFGFQTWGHRTLRALIESRHEVALVVTHPTGDGAYEKVWSDSVAELAEEHDIPVLLRERADDDELIEALKQAAPDVLVATNWRTWIPPRSTRRSSWTRYRSCSGRACSGWRRVRRPIPCCGSSRPTASSASAPGPNGSR